MTRGMLLAAVVLSTACAYHLPDAPTPIPPIAANVPYAMHLGTDGGSGQATVTAKVQNIGGVMLPDVLVQFVTTAGALSTSAAFTSSAGEATTILRGASTAVITATAGALTVNLTVASQPALPPPSTPPPPVPMPPPPPLGPLGLTISATASTIGASTILSANVLNSSGSFTMSWSYGDGVTGTGNSTTTAHTYAAAGNYPVSATLRDADGRSASASTIATVLAAAQPAPPPPTQTPGFVVTMTCTPARTTACNVSAKDKGVDLGSGTIVKVDWDWGDGVGQLVLGKPVASHTYTQAGTYRIESNTTATTVDGDKRAVVSATFKVE